MIPNSGVIPSDNPTVPIAEAVSNKAVINGIFSIPLIIIPPTRNKVTYIQKNRSRISYRIVRDSPFEKVDVLLFFGTQTMRMKQVQRASSFSYLLR